jgi:hypothetical protein
MFPTIRSQRDAISANGRHLPVPFTLLEIHLADDGELRRSKKRARQNISVPESFKLTATRFLDNQLLVDCLRALL